MDENFSPSILTLGILWKGPKRLNAQTLFKSSDARLESILIRLEAIAITSRLEAFASRLDAIFGV